MNLEFVLYEIVARVVAVYLFVDGSLALWNGLAERKTSVVNYQFMDMFVRLPDWSADRETAPLQYWFLISGKVFTLFACLVVAIFGWWHPHT